MVGSASKPKLQECEEYEEETAGNIYIYKSKDLGSNSWEEVALITEYMKGGEIKNMNAFGCVMHQHPTSEKFYIHCRQIVCITESNSIEDFNVDGKHECSKLIDFPVDSDDNSKRKGGDGRVSFRKDDDLYYVTIREQKNRKRQQKTLYLQTQRRMDPDRRNYSEEDLRFQRIPRAC